jgi:hypothetical protein
MNLSSLHMPSSRRSQKLAIPQLPRPIHTPNKTSNRGSKAYPSQYISYCLFRKVSREKSLLIGRLKTLLHSPKIQLKIHVMKLMSFPLTSLKALSVGPLNWRVRTFNTETSVRKFRKAVAQLSSASIVWMTSLLTPIIHSRRSLSCVRRFESDVGPGILPNLLTFRAVYRGKHLRFEECWIEGLFRDLICESQIGDKAAYFVEALLEQRMAWGVCWALPDE